MPSINKSSFEHQLFLSGRADDPGKQAIVIAFTTISANEEGAIELQVLNENLLC
jgi:hypothetical protein